MKSKYLAPEQIADYAKHLRTEERAPGTVEKYVRDARSFLHWLDGRPVSRDLAARWRDTLVERGLAPSTVNSMVAALNGLFAHLGLDECRVKSLRVQRRLFRDSSRELTRQEYRRLLDAARVRGQDRLALLMETICATGIRVSEVRSITVEAARAGRTDISLKGKIRTILLPSKLCRKLLRFARQQKTASGEIFLTRSGTSLNRRQIWAELKGLCRQAGVAPTKVFPHNLRHLFATIFYTACRDIARLADVLGHSSIETTRVYLISSGAEHARQLEALGLVT